MKRAIQKLKVMIAAALCAVGIGVAQAAFISPGITVNGIKPTKDGNNSGFTYNNGVFTLNSAGTTYTLAGRDSSGKVRVQASANCIIVLSDNFLLDLRSRPENGSETCAQRSAISLVGNVTVTIKGSGALYGASKGPAIRVCSGQKVILGENGASGSTITASGGTGAAAIGTGYADEPLGTIEMYGQSWKAFGGSNAAGIGHGNHNASGGEIDISGAYTDVYAQGHYQAAAIGTSGYSTGKTVIRIGGTGTIKAIGSDYGAAIGTGWRSAGQCEIWISGGTVIADSSKSEGGPGIGNGKDADTETQIVIRGGKIEAKGGQQAAGIGGGDHAVPPRINIQSGTVIAQGDPDTNSAMDIGAGRNADGAEDNNVIGGSILLANGKGTLKKNGSLLNCITVGNLGVSASVNLSFGAYGSNGISSDTAGNIYVWTVPGTYDDLYVNGERFSANVSSGGAVATPYVAPPDPDPDPDPDPEPLYPPPANDNFAKATTISGLSGRITGTTLGATRQQRSEVGGDCYDSDGSVWYRWKAPASGRIRFLVQHPKPASGYELSVYAWKGTSGTALSFPANTGEWHHNEEVHGVHGHSVTFDAVKGETYNITVHYGPYTECNGPFALSWGDGRWSFYLGKDGKANIGAATDLTGAVTIPSTLFGCEVTEIAEGGFMNQPGMTSVTIPSAVTTIGAQAFRKSGITSVTIPQGVSVIGASTFEHCNGLANVTIPQGVLEIGNSAFFDCAALTTVSIPESVRSIGDYAFDGCPLANLTIPSGVNSIGWYAFRDGAFASVTIPAMVASIGVGAFSACVNLKTVNFLGNCPEVDEGNSIYRGVSAGTPNDCVSIVPDGNSTWSAALTAGEWQSRPIRTDAVVPTTVKVTLDANGGSVSPATLTLDYGAQVGASLPDPTRSGWDFLGWWTDPSGGEMILPTRKVTADVTYYAHWKKLYTITFMANGGSPNMTLSAREGTPMFDWVLARWTPTRKDYELDGVWTAAEGGEKVTDAITVTSDMIFYAHWKLVNAPEQVTVTFDPNGGTLDEAARTRVINQNANLGALPTPTREGAWKFEGWWTQRTGGSVVDQDWSPKEDVTYYARWVKTVDDEVAEVVNGIKWYYSLKEPGQDGRATIFRAYGQPAAVRVDGTPISGTVMIPEKLGGVEVACIGGDAFINCTEMKRVKVPDTVKEIRSSAFSGCSSLQVAALGTGLTKIGPSAFKDCTSLTAAVIPATVKELGNYVFLNCTKFKGAKFLGDKPTVGTMIYEGTPATMKTVVTKKAKNWDADIAAGTWQGRPIEWAKPSAYVIDAGVYFKETLDELGFDVPTDGTPYSVTALGLPAGLKLKYNAAVTQKKKVKGKTKTVVVTPAKTTWWIEGVPTAGTSYAEMPPYLVITAYGKTETVPLDLEVDAQVPVDKGELTVGDTLSAEGWLDGVAGSGWTVTGLPAGLKYTAKALKKPKTSANSVYGTTTKAGLYTITAKKKKSGYFETLKFKVLVKPKKVDAARFGSLANRESYAYDEMDWDLTTDVAAVGGKVTKVTGLPNGLTFAAADTYGYKNAKKKTGKYLKQKGQTIVGRMTKAGTYVVTFTKNVKSGKKTVAKTAQILWVVNPSEAKPVLAFNDNGGDVVECSLGLKYSGTLMPFTANATSVTASGMPKGITLVNTGTGWAFQGYATKAGTYLVTVKATVEGNTVTQRIALKVNGLPEWAKGTYSCYLYNGAFSSYMGLGTISVTSAGKISGKFNDGWTWTFSGPCFTASDGETFFSAHVTAKYSYKEKVKSNGKWKTVTKSITSSFTLVVTPSDVGGIATMSADKNAYWMHEGMTAYGRQNLWGSAYKAIGSKLFVSGKKNKNKYNVYTHTMSYLSRQNELTIKVTPAGKATVTLKIDTGKTKKGKKVYWTSSCSTTVWPNTLPSETHFSGTVHYYFFHSDYLAGGYGDNYEIFELLK